MRSRSAMGRTYSVRVPGRKLAPRLLATVSRYKSASREGRQGGGCRQRQIRGSQDRGEASKWLVNPLQGDFRGAWLAQVR